MSFLHAQKTGDPHGAHAGMKEGVRTSVAVRLSLGGQKDMQTFRAQRVNHPVNSCKVTKRATHGSSRTEAAGTMKSGEGRRESVGNAKTSRWWDPNRWPCLFALHFPPIY